MNSPSLTRITDFRVPSGILGASVSADGDTAVAACMDGVYLIDIADESVTKLGQHNSYVSSAAFHAQDDIIVSAGYDGVIHWYRRGSATLIRELRLHDFWSWDMALSPDGTMLASVTGQYLAGGYKYEPQPEREPSVRILSATTGEILHSLSHVPSVQSVAFSPDSRFVAAGNLMGEVRVWDSQSGELVNSWTTDGFTSWGIVKSHCYLGGIFSMRFTTDGQHLLLAGMGPMRDPMAGNGRQLWQKWAWQEQPPRMLDETHKAESGEGLMEALAIHPNGQQFAIGGRLRGGDWNAALFDLTTGNRLTQIKTSYRITEAAFSKDGSQLILAGLHSQPKRLNDGRFPDFGRIEVYELS